MSLDAYNLNKLPINNSSVIDDNQYELNDCIRKINEKTIDIIDKGIERVKNIIQELHPVNQNYKFVNISNLSEIQMNMVDLNKKNSDMSVIGI